MQETNTLQPGGPAETQGNCLSRVVICFPTDHGNIILISADYFTYHAIDFYIFFFLLLTFFSETS